MLDKTSDGSRLDSTYLILTIVRRQPTVAVILLLLNWGQNIYTLFVSTIQVNPYIIIYRYNFNLITLKSYNKIISPVKKWMTTMKTWAIQANMDRKCASFLLVFLMLLIGQTPLISWIFVFAMFSVEYRFFKDYFKASSNTVDLQAMCLIYINDSIS